MLSEDETLSHSNDVTPKSKLQCTWRRKMITLSVTWHSIIDLVWNWKPPFKLMNNFAPKFYTNGNMYMRCCSNTHNQWHIFFGKIYKPKFGGYIEQAFVVISSFQFYKTKKKILKQNVWFQVKWYPKYFSSWGHLYRYCTTIRWDYIHLEG